MSKAHWVALATSARIGGKTVTRLLSHFGSLEAVFGATPAQLTSVKQIGQQTASAIARIDLSLVEADLKTLQQRGISILTWEDSAYPANLLHCDDAPPVLFVRGALIPTDAHAVAIVGTRQPSSKRAAFARQLAYELGQRGWTVVSGLALGIDTAAHQGALDAAGRTLAVLGSGLERLYPPANIRLAEQITPCGALLAEVYPRTTVSPQNLMARNRITSGLSRAVIVIEAQMDSGSVSTARRAWQQGRAVFAVAGSDAGCEALVRDGAQAIPPEGTDWNDLSQRLEQVEIALRPEYKA